LEEEERGEIPIFDTIFMRREEDDYEWTALSRTPRK